MIQKTPNTGGILDLLERVKEIQAQVPAEEWDKLPHDGSIDHYHYLYGSPKTENCATGLRTPTEENDYGNRQERLSGLV